MFGTPRDEAAARRILKSYLRLETFRLMALRDERWSALRDFFQQALSDALREAPVDLAWDKAQNALEDAWASLDEVDPYTTKDITHLYTDMKSRGSWPVVFELVKSRS